MRLNKKSFWKSLYKVSIVLFLVGYNFAPPVLAIEQLSNINNEETPDQSVLVTTEEDSDVLNEVPIDNEGDILPEGISDPEGIAKGVETVSRIMSRGMMPMANGTQYTISGTSGKWTWTNNNSIVNNLNTSHITWPKSGDKSGLSFTGVSDFSFDEGEEFDLGVLKHFNYPVSSAITNATLSVDINISNPAIGIKNFEFQMLINETNNVSPCPAWHTPGHPVCDDMITFPTSYSKETFEMNGKVYTLEIIGFINGAGNKVDQFITEERKTNEATLVGKLTSVDSQVEICHRTNSSTNPYEKITVNANATVDGHNDHNENAWYPGITGTWGDIIPRFLYFDGSGNIKEYVGKNNTDYGLSLLANDCKLPSGEIIVQKITIPSGSSASFDVTGTGVASIPNSPVTFIDGNTGTISTTESRTFKVYPGTYSFTETPTTGWIETDNDCKDIVITNNETETCTITNTRASSITIIKQAEPASNTAFSFTTTGTGLEGFTLIDSSADTDPEKKFSNLLPGKYSIVENLPSGWYQTGATCDNNQTPDKLDISAGSNVTCTFKNTQYGKLIFKKHANPASTQEFSFDVTGNGVEDFVLVDNSATEDPIKEFSNLLPGTYTISEKDVDGWYPEGVSCTSSLNHNEVITGLNLDAGETITCTFTNTKYGSISGYKYNDANGIIDEPNTDISPVPNWTIFIDENKNGVKDTGEKTVQTDPTGKYKFDELEPGTYWITEVITVGWMNLTLKTQVITIGAGEDRENVNFINVKEGSITVNKNVDSNGDGYEDITNSTDWRWTLDGVEYTTGSTKDSLNPGTYTIKEVNQDNYHFVSLECTGSDGIAISSDTATINLKSGEDVVCTYTNARNLGKLVVIKEVINDNGGTKKATDFSFQIGSESAISFTQDGENTLKGKNEFTRYAGLTYSITEVEANQDGYTTTYDNCTNVVVPHNGTATCTITNNDNVASLQLVKEVVNNNGGTAFPTDWTLSANGPTPLTGVGGVTSGMDFAAGTYTLSESAGPAGYSASKWSCTNNIAVNEKNEITLALGQSTVCTIINDDIAPSLTLVKKVENTYGGSANITDWNLKADGPTIISGDGGVTSGEKFEAGAYTLSESGDVEGYSAGDWSCDNTAVGEGNQITLALGQSTTCTITNKDLPAKIIVKKDVVDWSGEDIYSSQDFTINLTSGDSTIATGTINDKEGEAKITTFENLSAGTYDVKEINIPDGYISQGCYPIYDEEVNSTPTIMSNIYHVRNGESLEFVCTNEIIKPLLEIEKSNDKQYIDQYAGNEVTYTITVTAPEREGEGQYLVKNVKVSDIAPAGFNYISGTWTGKKTDGTVIEEPTYDGTSPAKWEIGEMVEGDIVILTYRTKISLPQEPGTYPDIAWVKGDSLADETVFGVSATDSNTPFVGTDVTVIEPIETEGGEVLGATTTLELPKTGASAYLTLVALIMMILGTLTLLFKPFKKFKYLFLAGLMAISFITLITPKGAMAANDDIKVSIMQPASPTNKTSFNIGFVALDLNSKPITVTCFKDSETVPFATISASAGNCPAQVSASGTYSYYVIAESESGEQSSNTVTVDVNLEKPSPVIDYSKAGNTLKFKTPDDGKIVKVEIHRSEKPSYTANESTRIHVMPVTPNTEHEWIDTTAEAGKTYYYALRTVDAQGNISTFVSDPEVIPVVPTTTGSVDSTTTPTGEVKGSEGAGEVAGEEDTIKNGDTDEGDKEDEKEGEEEVKEGAKNFLEKWYIWLPIILVIGGIIFYVRKQRKD